MQWSITTLLPRLRVGLLGRWPAAIGALVLRCEAAEAFELLLLTQVDLDLDHIIDQRTKILAVDARRIVLRSPVDLDRNAG